MSVPTPPADDDHQDITPDGNETVSTNPAQGATLPSGQRPDPETGHGSNPHAATVIQAVPQETHHQTATISTLPADAPTVGTRADLAATQITTPVVDGHPARIASGGSILSATGRTVRTRPNPALPVDTQTLDVKLQGSRTSVLADVSLYGIGTGRLRPEIREAVAAGETIGRYAVQRPLAAGGMGAVLEIDDQDFHRHAAMKVIHAQHARHPQALERFLAEAQVTAQLEHPNIVPIHDLGVMEDGTLYFTMKLIEGQSLGTVVKLLRAKDPVAIKHWNLEEKLLVFLKVLDGVGFAHARGVIHRDIKPDNIMLGHHGEVLVVDWGIAKVLGSAQNDDPLVQSVRDQQGLDATMQGQVMGTLHYMPPEQAAGQIDLLNARSDVYSLGATLYELLAIRRCVDGGSMQAILTKVMVGEILPLAEAAPELPADLVAIVAKSMAVDQNQRYANCAEMADDLRRFLAGQAVAARRRNLIERFGAWVQRNRVRVAVGGTTALLVAAGVFGTLWWQEQANIQRVSGLIERIAEDVERGGIDALRAADRKLAEAQALRPADPGLKPWLTRVPVALSRAEREQAEAQEAEASRRRADELLTQGRSALSAGALAEANETLSAAFRLQPEDPEIESTLNRARDLMRNERIAAQMAAAQAARDEGDKALAAATDADPLSNTVDDLITRAEQAYALAEQDGMAPAGTADQVAAAALLRRQINEQRNRHRAQQAGEAARTAAATAFAEGNLTRAQELVSQALGHQPADEQAVKLRDEVLAALRSAQAAAEARRARAAAISKAQGLAAEGEQIAALLEQLRQGLPQLSLRVEQLERGPVATDPRIREELWAAREAVDEAQARVVDLQSQAEAAWQGVLATLRDDPDHPLAARARSGLGELYLALLDQTRRQGDPASAAGFRDLVKRYDAKLLPPTTGLAQLQLTGSSPSGSLRVRAITRGRDGRYLATGPEQTLRPDLLELDAGRWQLRDEHTTVSVVLSPDTQHTLYWPGPPPVIAGHRLRYVPGPDGGRGFYLAENETTMAAYAQFIHDPAILSEVTASWMAVLNELRSDTIRDYRATLSRIPRLAVNGNELWVPIPRSASDPTPERFDIPPGVDDMPVCAITRADAEAYCAWLSQQSGFKVRLPSLDEWQQAANGADSERRFPWGPGFDPLIPLSVLAGHREEPGSIAEQTADLGPYGHRHLGGNVREWLSDRPHPKDPSGQLLDAMIAGGGWSSGRPHLFLADTHERVEGAALSTVIGFRILVELPVENP